MTGKRFRKLIMALGAQRVEINKALKETDKIYAEARRDYNPNLQLDYQMLFDSIVMDYYRNRNIPHPAYNKKLENAFTLWVHSMMSDGDFIHVFSQCIMATKDMIVIDRRKEA